MTSHSRCVRDLSPPQRGRLCTLLSHHAISINRLLNRFEELLVRPGFVHSTAPPSWLPQTAEHRGGRW